MGQALAPGDFAEYSAGPGNVLEHLAGENQVECAIREGQGLAVGDAIFGHLAALFPRGLHDGG